MRLVIVGTTLSIVATSLALGAGAPQAHAATTDFWTEPAHTSVFKDSLPSGDSGRAIRLDMARNEYEAAQVVLRRNEAFTIQAVTPSTLTGPSGTIAASNVTYNFVDYQFMDRNTHNGITKKTDIYPTTRTAPADFPDRLSNERIKAVPARTTQATWIRAYVPAATPGGTYTGTVAMVTDKGTTNVPISIDVRAVTLPESKGGAFTTSLWHVFAGNTSWGKMPEIIERADIGYGYPRYTTQWWELITNVARMFEQYRTNNLQLPVIKLLADAGSKPNAQGGYDFDWTRFDQIVELFMAEGAVKRLEGFPEPAFSGDGHPGSGDAVRDIEVIRDVGGVPTLVWVNWNSAEGERWQTHYLPALRDHLRAKGWENIFWMHAGDEPRPDNVADYRRLAQRMHQIWPGIRLGDAVDVTGISPQIADLNHQATVQEFVYDAEAPLYDQMRAAGKEVWLYNSTAPRGNFLNRFIDQPQWYQRMTIWYAYSRNLPGYLHWAMNNWAYPLEDQDAKGDGLIVRADKVRNTVEVTPRYESLRDGIEDFELLNLLGQRDLGLARGLAASLVQRSDKFIPDIAYMQRIRELALDAAAGLPVAPDLARSATAAASSGNAALAVDGNPSTAWQPASGSGTQSIRLDFGRQVQLDAVRLRWGAVYGTTYKVAVSYDGARWTDVQTVAAGDGGTDLVGLNSKARHLRVEVTAGSSGGLAYALADLEVAGFALAKTNLAGGRTYERVPEPNAFGDTGIESTDGVLADAGDDGRTWGYGAPEETATVRLDLGAVQLVDSAKIHAYEEFPDYRPNSVRIATSVDGTTFTQRGVQFVPRGASGIWYDFSFPPSSARYVEVTFTKAYGGDASVMFLDEIEVYAAAAANLVANRPYVKTMPAPTDPAYPDTDGREATDGVANSGFGVGYAYRLASAGQQVTVDVLIDLGASRAVERVRARKYDDGVHAYEPSAVRVSTGEDAVNLTLRGTVTAATGVWFELPVSGSARFVKVSFDKTRTHDFADYLFLDEIEVLDAGGVNVALNRPYLKAHPALVDPPYPDSSGRESTDGTIAGGFGDGHGYAFRLATAGQSVTVDLLVDLGVRQTVSTVRVRDFDDAVHDYSPDTVAVLVGDNPLAVPSGLETSSATDQWFELRLPPTTGRYLTVRLTKTRTHDFADYLFADEITATT